MNILVVNFTNILLRAFFKQKGFVKLLCANSLGFIIFWQKDISPKAARNMLMKVTWLSFYAFGIVIYPVKAAHKHVVKIHSWRGWVSLVP